MDCYLIRVHRLIDGRPENYEINWNWISEHVSN